MTTDHQMEDAKVISVATGTRCISGEYVSLVGVSLNDTHAEVIARRCLCDFFYAQLEMHDDSGSLLLMRLYLKISIQTEKHEDN
ncbi:Double-stranded RNA-specific editase 1 [Zootermopsis nevadensis]|uniref:Double-stranded RNA-specific editase 1 n=1 Tax=Zootermopsis nevadensis TaxID=136037 RepID=A0A067QY75_ZOONE|nr:Double-stranded RNA-specific editase 1 [Zootermopsis nevadensis]